LFYIIGDIHGYFDRLVRLFDKLAPVLNESDTLIFLGDYVDRGAHSYEVIDYLVGISRNGSFSSVFLKGNHESMLMKYLGGEDRSGVYIFNGGDATIRSYVAHQGQFKLPSHHQEFFGSLGLYYEGDDFIAVHAGLNPKVDRLDAQDEYDMLWIREKFFHSDKHWDKTIIFGHTPVSYLAKDSALYVDIKRNIIGIDSGVIFGNHLTCLTWPGKNIIRG
jgi:serine/threonine protein phosphatase 1